MAYIYMAYVYMYHIQCFFFLSLYLYQKNDNDINDDIYMILEIWRSLILHNPQAEMSGTTMTVLMLDSPNLSFVGKAKILAFVKTQ